MIYKEDKYDALTFIEFYGIIMKYWKKPVKIDFVLSYNLPKEPYTNSKTENQQDEMPKVKSPPNRRNLYALSNEQLNEITNERASNKNIK